MAQMATLLLWPFYGLAGQGRVEMRRVPSRALGVEKAIAVYLPASYDRSSVRFPVAYYLHGGGGNERTWVDRLALDSHADSLHREGMPEAILVMPDGDTGYWIDWEEPEGFQARCTADPHLALLQEAHFVGEYLAQALAARGLGYAWFPELGGRRPRTHSLPPRDW